MCIFKKAKIFMKTLSRTLIYSFLFFSCACFAQQDSLKEKSKWVLGAQINTIDKYFPYGNALAEVNGFSFDDKSSSKRIGLSFGLKAFIFLNPNYYFHLKTGTSIISIDYHRDGRDENPSNFIVTD